MKSIIIIAAVLASFALFSCAGEEESDDAAKSNATTQAIEDGKIEMLAYGKKLPEEVVQCRQDLAAEYGFEVKIISGDDITQQLLDSIRQHNDIIINHVAQKHGDDWYADYGIQLDECWSEKQAISKIAPNSSKVDSAAMAFLIYGELEPEILERCRKDIAKEYGFVIHRVSGCEITDKLVDSVKQHNDNLVTLLADVHGKDWYQKFNSEVTSCAH